METFQQRMIRFCEEYNAAAWPNMALVRPTEDWEFDVMEIHADMYASAHVDGEHVENGICAYGTAAECGERSAAARWVETH